MRRAWLSILLLLPMVALAADFEFAGSLERVAPESILIRLADGTRISARLPKAGAFAAETISAQYKLADEVQITCKPMDATHCAELKSLKFLRPPTPKERALVLGSPKSPADSPELAPARKVNLDRAANMPNFVADETAKRYASPRSSSPPAWKLVDKIESEITIKGRIPTRQHVSINGKPWNSQSSWLPGINWGPQFGTEIKPVFDPECPTAVDFEGRQEVRGKQLLMYRVTSPPDGCFETTIWGAKHHTAAQTGRVLVEDPGGSMIQHEEEASEFPKGFGVASEKEAISWDYVKIGDASYLLPVALNYFVDIVSGDTWHVTVEYGNHRHFEASTNVTFH